MNEHTFNIPEGLNLNDIPVEEPKDDFPAYGDVGHQPAPVDFRDAELDMAMDLPPPQVILQINGEPLGTLGNFSLLIGKAKSRKTFLVSYLMAQAFKQNHTPGKSRIVFVDTEQAAYHSLKVGKRVLKLIEEDEPARGNIPFHIFALRKYDTRQRLQMIEQIIEYYDDLAILVIDGIRDLVTSINDEEQATDMTSRLLRWTEEKNIHILTVLHQNKGDFNARGHLGTELVNKAETTVSVSKDSNNDSLSKVEPEYTRHKEFPKFAFSIDENGLPQIETEWSERKETSSREKLAPHEVAEHLHIKVLQQVKRNVDKPSYNDLVKQVKLSVCEHVEVVGDNKAKDYVLYYQNKNLIEKSGKDRSPKSHYEINPYGAF